jgi:hypothetical protein
MGRRAHPELARKDLAEIEGLQPQPAIAPVPQGRQPAPVPHDGYSGVAAE